MIDFGNETTMFPSNSSTTETKQSTFNGGPISCVGFYDLASSATGTDSLSVEAQAYLEKLHKMLNPEGAPKVDIRNYPCPVPSQLYVMGKFAIILTFAESMTRSADCLPLTTIYFPKINEVFVKNVGPDYNLLNIVLVDKRDYENRAQPMAGYIRAVLEFANRTDIFQNFEFLKMEDAHVVCYTDKTMVRDLLHRWSPHHVQDRTDFGFVLGVRKNNGYGQTSQPEMFNPIAVATGYNEFRLAQTSNFIGNMPMPMMPGMPGMMMPTVKFNQLVHISNIVTKIPSRRLLTTLLIPAAYHVFIQQGLCRQQYYVLGQGADVCSLMIDPATGQPYRAESTDQVAAFFAGMCMNPVLVMDVMDGRARVPGVEAMADPRWYKRIIDDLSSFMNIDFPLSEVAKGVSAECGGVVRLRGNDEDIRTVDYFHMLESNKELASKMFLNRPVHATDRFKEIANLHQNGESNYYTLHAMFNEQFLNTLMNCVGPQLRLVTDIANQQAGFMDTSILASAAAGYGGITTGFNAPMSGMGGGVFGMPNTKGFGF